MFLLGIIGQIGSGKDTAANYIIHNYNFVKLSFGSILKDVVSCIYNWDRNMLEGVTEESRIWRETIDSFWNITPRQALISIGTDLFRNHYDENIWIKSLENKISKLDKNIIINDCRFINEVKFIKQRGGIIIKINRDGYNKVEAEINLIDKSLIDYDIQNDNLENLYNQLDNIIANIIK
jgi:hypothetical protein